MKTIVLVGPPGIGKSTIVRAINGQQFEGKTLSAADLDEIISERTGLSPGKLIRSLGEERFREEESRALAEVLQVGTPQTVPYLRNLDVLAVGGGTFCRHSNQEVINQLGFSVFLDESEEELARRILSDELESRRSGLGTKRPLIYPQELTGEEDKEPELETTRKSVESLLKERLPHYRKAHLTLECRGKSGTEIISEILKLVARRNVECL